jgi:serine/threonine-protein kinase
MDKTVTLRASRPLGPQLLDEHLRRGAATREASVARIMCVASLCCLGFTLLLGPLVGWKRTLVESAMTALYAAWYGWLSHALPRRWFHPALRWFNVCLEVSAGTFLFLSDLYFEDAEQALTNPFILLWGAVVLLAALRSSRRLAIFAGALAAVELLLLYAFLAWPRLEEPVPLMLTPPFIGLRAVYMFITGCMASLVASHLRRMAAEALSAVRERDLMGKYFLHERLGAGGMAEVFRATYSPEGGFEKVVAVKRILPACAEDPDFVTLFRREAELGSQLHHPNIVQVLDIGRFADTYFLAMEFIDGPSLRSLIKHHGPLPFAAVAYLGAELASALDYVHHRTTSDGALLNLVHRDVNPPNILLSRIGEVKLGDFGIARAAHHASLTIPGRVSGKPGYLAPEQARSELFDGRADLFALGLTLHEALTGRRLIRSEIANDPHWGFTSLQLPPPSQFRPEVPPALDSIVMGLLQWEPSMRTASGRLLREQLCTLSGSLAPYPHGQMQLAQAVQEVLARKRDETTAPPARRETPAWSIPRLRPACARARVKQTDIETKSPLSVLGLTVAMRSRR